MYTVTHNILDIIIVIITVIATVAIYSLNSSDICYNGIYGIYNTTKHLQTIPYSWGTQLEWKKAPVQCIIELVDSISRAR